MPEVTRGGGGEVGFSKKKCAQPLVFLLSPLSLTDILD